MWVHAFSSAQYPVISGITSGNLQVSGAVWDVATSNYEFSNDSRAHLRHLLRRGATGRMRPELCAAADTSLQPPGQALLRAGGGRGVLCWSTYNRLMEIMRVLASPESPAAALRRRMPTVSVLVDSEHNGLFEPFGDAAENVVVRDGYPACASGRHHREGRLRQDELRQCAERQAGVDAATPARVPCV